MSLRPNKFPFDQAINGNTEAHEHPQPDAFVRPLLWLKWLFRA